jgi:hypothetical protein
MFNFVSKSNFLNFARRRDAVLIDCIEVVAVYGFYPLLEKRYAGGNSWW